MSEKLKPCADCGMPVASGEYHPFAACLMFKACGNSDTVRANLAAVRLDATAELAKTMSLRALESASQPGGGKAQKWQPLTAPGQVSEGDKLSFTIGDKRYNETVKGVLDPGTDVEEVIYNMRKNFYFITSMAIDGSSSHKNVQFKRAAPSAGNGEAKGDGNG